MALKFNHEKSNVLVTGKRINNNKLWQLGINHISEVNSYKYLGVHISRNLSDHSHLSETIKKGNRLIGYIKSIIDSHDDFNRVYYGDVLWKSILFRRLITLAQFHPTVQVIIKVSINYKFRWQEQSEAPGNTPAVALLGDLGWSNFKSIHDKVKVKFFSRL